MSPPRAAVPRRVNSKWLRELGQVERVGIEGCGSYGAGLARLFRSEDVEVLDICHPNRQMRRRRGKSDLLDAEAAARAVLAKRDGVTPKSADGPVEAMRALRVARSSAIKARDQATNQLHALIVTAPLVARDRFCEPKIDKLVDQLLDADPGTISDQVGYETAVRSLARRWKSLDAEAADLAVQLKEIVTEAAPTGRHLGHPRRRSLASRPTNTSRICALATSTTEVMNRRRRPR